MKKLALLLTLALPLAFASCGDEDDTVITLDQTSVNLDYGKTLKLKASEGGVTWGSSNEFVATVDNKGEITAKHIGSATITATKDGSTARCTVTVAPTNNFFNTYITWGSSKAAVKAAMSSDLTLLVDNENQLMYTNPAQAYPWYGFIFVDGSLDGSAVYFTDAQFDSEDFNGYLAQRYTKIGEYDGEGVLYVNAPTVSAASESAIVEYDGDEDVWTVTYQPVKNTKSQAVDIMIHRQLKALYKEAKH